MLFFTATDARGRAKWLGVGHPQPGDEIDVELSVPGDIAWRDVAANPEPLGAGSNDLTVVQGVVDELDHNGVMVLRTDDGVVLIDTVGEPPIPIIGTRVRICPDVVELYPTGV
jgi:hypothetical protein